MVHAIVGANWGDEGKGKITDMFAQDADVVARFQGGANAGHTIITDKGKVVLHILPSGSCYEKTENLVGNGVALDVHKFQKEIENVRAAGFNPKVLVSNRAQILMPYHVDFDKWEEERLGARSYGSTKSGIAPFYSDKYAKIGITVDSLYYRDFLRDRVSEILDLKNQIAQAVYHKEPYDLDQIMDELAEYAEILKPYVCDSVRFMQDAVRDGKNILIEGQLGSLRDPDFGIYPMSTSSNTISGYGAVGASVPSSAITRVTAVVKAYSSAVGAGPFVSEIFGDEANELRERGGDKGEYGATIGRPRRMGWFDCVASRYGCLVQGATDVAFTVVDALGYLDEIPVCVGYEYKGEVLRDFPTYPVLLEAKPVLKVFPGWKCDIRGIREYDKLPQACRDYIEFIEKEIEVPIKIVCNGPKREDVIFRG
ncbi:MAG TPA: adenylosuccinate synthase [Oscillospiraceae bacterium]|nr:adenylosuccinate synthase [Oscillospiraceae bacterium]